jgi:hypothetical protein
MTLSLFRQACIDCEQRLPLEAFYKHPHAKNGRMGVCKECHKARMYVRRLTNPAVQAYDRQRHQAPKRKKQGVENARRWRAENPVAYKAQTAVSNAIRDGRIDRAPCAICSSTQNVHGHHKDYNRRLDVVWLCARCHHRIHAIFPEIGGHYEKSA